MITKWLFKQTSYTINNDGRQKVWSTNVINAPYNLFATTAYLLKYILLNKFNTLVAENKTCNSIG